MFTTVLDNPGETTWQSAGWDGIRAIGLPVGATSLSFTDCTFEYSGFIGAGTLYGNQTNGVDSEVNISVSGCTFRDPKAGATAIRYDNGYNTVGTGTISVSNSTFTGYGRGVQVLDNQEDAVNTTVTGCTFSSMSVRPLEINGGRQASVTDCTFDNFVAGQHNGAVLIFDTYSATSETQTVTLTGNIFNYGDTAYIYPVLIGAGTKINENLITAANNTFGTEYLEDYLYIQLTRGVGYSTRHRNAVWGDAGMPYLLTSEITITGTDEINQSSLTIKPGVTVCLGDGNGTDNLTVRGALTAEGTADKPITFTKKTGMTYGNEITAGNNLKGSIVLKHCIMDGLYRGIGITSPGNVASSYILLENCTVQNTQHSMYLAGLNVSVKNCTLMGKGVGTGGSQYVNSITIEGCSITASGTDSGNGISLEPTKSVVVKNCLIAGFSNYGIAIINNGYQTLEEGAPLIENCTVTGNGYGVVFSRGYSSAYGAFIRNSIIADNTRLDLANKVYTSGESNYPVTIADGSIAYSLIGDDGASLSFDQLGYCEHPTLDRIHRIAAAAYSNRVAGTPLFADTANGDYHLKSAAGRWNSGDWVNDDVTSSCIDAGDPVSPYANEPTPNGGRINIGCYGNTAEASKSVASSESYTVTLPDGKVDGYDDAYTVAAHGGSISPVATGGSYSFTITVGNAFYKTDTFKVKANNIDLIPDNSTGVYSIQNITANQTITVDGVARIAAPTITTQPTDQSVAVGVKTTFSVVAIGYNLTYSWQVSSDGGITWENISGAADAQYEIASPTLLQSGLKYRCWVKSSALSGSPNFNTVSNIVTLSVTDSGVRYNISVSVSPSAGGTITASPTRAIAGETITLTITPDTGKRLKSGSLKFNDGAEDHTISGTIFTMPASNVTVTAEFEDIPPIIDEDDDDDDDGSDDLITNYDKVMADIAALSIGYAPGDSATAVTQNVSLAITGALYGSSITWASSNTTVISDSGVVTRPGFASGDAVVTVTATVYNNGANSTKDFDLVVLKLPQITYKVTFDKNGGDTEADPATKEVIQDGNVGTLPTAPTRSGYTFNGWNTQANGSGTALTAAIEVTGSITVYAQWSRNSSGGGGGSSGGSGGTSTPVETPKTETSVVGNTATATTTVTAAIGSSGNAAATVSRTQVSDAINKAMEEAEKQGEDMVARVEIKVEAPTDATTTEANIPKEAIDQASEAGIGALTISTPVASITFDNNTLSALSEEATGDVKITASKVEASSLSPKAQRTVGDRPVFDFSVTSGDKTISEFGGNVLVSVPYAHKEGEDANAIVIYYINDSSKLEVVSNCLYDPAIGRVSFSTRYFSQYAVGYNKVNFKDVAKSAWYSKAVGFIAAREITIGTGGGNFSPEVKLTRGQFIVMLMKTYSIAPDADPKDNFVDAGATYYTGYLATAKRLSISNGVGNNMFAPDKAITRQEMFTLLYNVLKTIGRLPEETDGKPLSDFADAENIASWAKEAMTLLVETGTISGNGGKLSPMSTSTRAEMAQVLYNLLSK